MDQEIVDRRTGIFYGTLLGLVLLDLIVILWILNSFTHFETSAYASQNVPVVSDTTKPSPFEVADSKRHLVQAAKRKPRVDIASGVEASPTH